MLVPAIDELATGDVISYFLSLPELPGQGPLPCRHHFEGEHVLVPDLIRVMLGQVLCHGVLLGLLNIIYVDYPTFIFSRLFSCLEEDIITVSHAWSVVCVCP